jgi:septal ring factor EnvC (AmiA/AmiB activator)
MHPSDLLPRSVLPLWVAVSVAAAAFIVGEVGGYSLQARRMAESVIARQQQITVELKQFRTQLDELTSKVNALAARPEPQPVVPLPAVEIPAVHNIVPIRRPTENLRLEKMQSQLDQQSRAIDQQARAIADTRSQLETTHDDLSATGTQLTGSIARTHDELLRLQKKGERNYYEFDIAKSKQFDQEGPLGVRLSKANAKHQYADLDLIVEDRTVSQKHVNLYQPVMFYASDRKQPVELVINNISKDHIHGYVSSAKYRQSESVSIPSTNGAGTNNAVQSKSSEQSASQHAVTPPQ